MPRSVPSPGPRRAHGSDASGPVLDLDAPLDRRLFLKRGIALSVGVLPAASLLAACGDDDGMMGGGMPDWMMSGDGMMGAGMMEEMPVIRELLVGHETISRRVEDIPGGIRSWTTSEDPELAEAIATHVAQMSARVDDGDPIRHMDPLFREIFEHHEAIEIDIDRIEGGVVVVETSDDPQVELLIRQHAHRAVSEFVAEGMARAMEPTPLPDGYREG